MEKGKLSRIEEQFWILFKLDPNNLAYDLINTFQCDSNLNVQILENAIYDVVQRHECLRTIYFEEGRNVFRKVVQISREDVKVPEIIFNFPFDMENLPEDLVNEVYNSHFDLGVFPLFQFKVFSFSNDIKIFTLRFHHIILDNGAFTVFTNEMYEYYNSYIKNEIAVLEPVKSQYSRYIELSNEVFQTEKYKEDVNKWAKELEHANNLLLPYDKQPENTYELEGDTYLFEVNEKLYGEIKSFAEANKTNAYRVMLAAYAIMFHRFSNQDEFTIGIPLTNRIWKEIRETVGCFINTLPMIFSFNEKKSLMNVLQDINVNMFKILRNQHIPFLDLLEKLRTYRKTADSLYQVGFTFRDYPEIRFENIKSKRISFERNSVQVDLFTYFWENGNCLTAIVEFNKKLFHHDTIARWSKIYCKLLSEIIKHPNEDINTIDLTPDEDKAKIDHWNTTNNPYEDQICIHQKFEIQAQQHPQRIALHWNTGKLTYSEMNIHSNRLAHFLLSKNVKPDMLISICLNRSPEMMIGIYAILKAGGAYMPIDPKAPKERLIDIIEDGKPAYILTSKLTDENLPKESDKLIYIDDILKKPFSNIDTNPETDVNSQNLAYIIYTSGSTGKPKGVMIEHHSVFNRLGWMQEAYPLSSEDIIMQKTPVTFDVSVWELFWWGFNGAGLALLPVGGEKEPETIVEFINKFKITVMHFVPSMFGAFLNHLSSIENKSLINSLCNIFLSGEALPHVMVNQFYSLMGEESHISLINLYGPTEATVDVSYFNCPKRTDNEVIYIGKSISNTKLFVVNKQNKIQPIGIPGELIICGVNLSRGYLNRDDLNREKFIDFEYFDGTIMRAYRTGDLVKWNEDGEIYYIGRIDNQVKIRGFRIELGDIESKLLEHNNVDNCAVIVNRKNPANPLIVAYASVKKNHVATQKELKDFLGKKLPEYMVPSIFVILDDMPLTSSGKVNRKALPEPDIFTSEDIVDASTDYEKILVDIWKEVLGINKVGIKSNFFDLGGNSILIPLIVTKLKDKHGIQIRTVDIFANPNIESLASFISRKNDTQLIKSSEKKSSVSYKNKKEISNDIAIVGLSGRFPGANNIQEFWENLLQGKESITEFTDEELEKNEYDFKNLINKTNYVKSKGIINNVDIWDPGFFGFSGHDAKHLDPQHRVWLELVWHALEDAGCDPFTYKGNIGVYAGSAFSTYLLNNILNNPDAYYNFITMKTMENYQDYLYNDPTFLPTRTSYVFNLKGPSVNVQTACSTSLVSVIQSCNSLINGESDMCIAGGIAIHLPVVSGYLYYEGGIKSPDGHCRPFDKDGNGIVASSGAGVVVLKRLSDAIKDKNQIHAVIKGWGINNDGNAKVGYTAPSAEGQSLAISIAQEMANISPAEIQYIEAHGTATPLGDPIELDALTKVFSKKTDKKQFCAIGSVKSNVGHTDIAAGVCGLIKATLVAKNSVIPPTIHYKEPNPNFDIENSPFYVADKVIERTGENPFNIGVSSFGMGGTNAHVVIQDFKNSLSNNKNQKQILPISAKSEYSLDQLKDSLIDYLNNNDTNLNDVSYTLQIGRSHMPKRSFIVVDGKETKIEKSSFTNGKLYEDIKEIVFSFPGQGAQYINMGRSLYDSNEIFRNIMDECFDILKIQCNIDMKSLMFNEDNEVAATLLSKTMYTQPALFCIEYATAYLLMKYGIQPKYLIGHSIGEYTAACISGVFDLETTLKVVAKRGELMQKMPEGDMLAVKTSADLLVGITDSPFEIAAINSPEFCTISFKPENRNTVIESLNKENIEFIPLETSHAFHSSDFDPILSEFETFLEGCKKSEPRIPFISCLTGDFITENQATSSSYWAKQLRNTVYFNKGIDTICASSEPLFIETGPNTHLSGLIRQNTSLSDKSSVIVTLGKKSNEPDEVKILKSIGQLWNKGFGIDFTKIFDHNESKIISLPSYPFEYKRYWIDSTRMSFGVDDPQNNLVDDSIESETASDTENVFTPIQSKLLIIWKNQFGEDNIGLNDDFYELGGHSLLALQILNKINEFFHVSVLLKDFLNNPTISQFENILVENINKYSNPVEDNKLEVSSGKISNLPLTNDQLRLYLITKIDQDNPAYNIPYTLKIEGKLDQDKFIEAVKYVYNRHDVFKTRIEIVDDGPRAFLNMDLEPSFKVIDWSKEEKDNVQELQQFLTDEIRASFDFENGPLYRSSLVKLNDSNHIFHITAHHTIIDGWSWDIFSKELFSGYNFLKNNEKISLPPLKLQYYDYAQKVSEIDTDNTCAESLVYWKNKLNNAPSVINFPWDKARPEVPSGKGGVIEFIVSPELTLKLKEISKKNSVSLFATVYASFILLLHKYSSDETICLGIPVSNRNNVDYEPLIGLFVNTLVIKTDITDPINFNEFLRTCNDNIIGALSHQDLPFEKLVNELDVDRNLNTNPLFQIMFSWTGSSSSIYKNEEINVSPYLVKNTASPLDLSLYANESDGCIKGFWEYSEDVLFRDTVVNFKNNFIALLNNISRNPELLISNYSILSSFSETFSKEFNNTANELTGILLHELFEQNVSKFKNKTAVYGSDEELTYGELDEKSTQLANMLINKGLTTGSPVGVSLDRNPKMLIAVLGILKAGGCYLPLDPSFPDDRLVYMLEDSGAKYLITQESIKSKYSSINCEAILLDDLQSLSIQPNTKIDITLHDDLLAYMIYTSGSTGKPKGVKIHHRAVVNFIQSMSKKPGMSEDDKLLAVTTLSFDISVLEMFLPISCGASVIIATSDESMIGPVLMDKINSFNITILQATPATWNILINSKWKGSKLKALCGGEAMSPELAKSLIPLVDSLWNMYGPTETTVWSSCVQITNPTPPILVGQPIDNTTFYIMDKHNHKLPVGVYGEVVIGGEGVTKGYHNRDELTHEKFIELDGELIYRTGDNGRIRLDGNIEISGRIDNQIKLRGFRIEPGEIESQLCLVTGIKEAVVKIHKFDETDERLVAFLRVNENNIDINMVRSELSNTLPAYMIPAIFDIWDDFPRTPNGKIDRKKLIYTDTEDDNDVVEENKEKLSAIEEEILAVWQKQLKIKQIEIRDDFFTIGGNSLLAINLLNEIEKKYSTKISFRDFLAEYNSVQKMASFIEKLQEKTKNNISNNKDKYQHIFCLSSNGTKPPVFAVYCEQDFTEKTLLKSEHPIYAFVWPGVDGKEFEFTTVEEVASSYFDQILEVQPKGPFYLVGFSFGGYVAYELAIMLQKKTGQKPIVVMLDTSHPQVKYEKHDKFLRQKEINGYFYAVMDYYFLRGFRFLSEKYNVVVRHLKKKLGQKYTGDEINEMIFQYALKTGQIYRPGYFDGEMLLFKTYKNPVRDPELGWGEYVKNVTTHPLNGNHMDVLYNRDNKITISNTLYEYFNNHSK